MKFQSTATDLKHALAFATASTPRNSPREILQNVLIEVMPHSVIFTGTDLEVAARYEMKAEELDVGALCVNAATLNNIVRNLDGDIIVEADDKQATIAADGAVFNLQIIDAQEFPTVPEISENAISLDAPAFADAIALTSYAAARESMRFAINGVLIDINKKDVTMVGTDGHRLASKQYAIKDKVEFKGILPVKGLDLVRKMLDGSDLFQFDATEKYVGFQCGNATLVIRLLEGTFPNWQDVIPQYESQPLTLPVDDFTSALKRASIMTSDVSRAVRLTCGSGVMELSSRTPGRGHSIISLPVEYEEPEMLLGLNPEYLVDMLNAVGTDFITMQVGSKEQPAVLRTDNGFVYVVMPISLED